MRLHAIVVTVVSVCAAVRAGPPATFEGLGADGHAFSSATAISADASTVVGNSFDETGSQAFRWTRSGGMQSLGGINGELSTRSFAFNVNADGSVVVGRAEQPDNVQAFRWTSAFGMIGLAEQASELSAVSADGTIAAGRFNTGNSPPPADIPAAGTWSVHDGWNAIGGALPDSNAFGISADGSVVVGINQNHAFRWSQNGGIVDIGPSGVTPKHSIARDVSDDGSVVVGDGGDSESAHAFRWTTTGGLAFIAPNEPLDTFAYATDADGSIIVGQLGEQRAFVWDAAHGLRELQDLLAFQGADVTGWTLERAFGVSGDGRTIVGDGTNPSGNTEAWIATLSEESTTPIPLPSPLASGIMVLLLTPAFLLLNRPPVNDCAVH